MNEKIQNNSLALIFISCILITLYLVSNILSVKIVSIGNFPLFDAGTITFPFTYMLGDVLTEIWGYTTSKKIIFLTFFCNVILILLTIIGSILPSPTEMFNMSVAFSMVFTYVPRIVVASLIAFLLGELINAKILEQMKSSKRFNKLWHRTIFSSIIGYILDTIIFCVIAFLGTISFNNLIFIITFQYIFKLFIEIVFGTPLAYILIKYLKIKLK